MRVCNNHWVINIRNFQRLTDESVLSECPVSAAVEKSFTAQYLYSPFNKRRILWILMSSTGLGVFGIVRQNGTELFNIFLSCKLAGQVNHSAGQASIELKVLIDLLYTKLYNIYLWNLQILPENFLYADTRSWRKPITISFKLR